MTSTAIGKPELDTWLDRHARNRASLCPGRGAPTPFESLWRSLDVEGEVLVAVQRATGAVVEAIVEHYPDNVFWDLDRLIYELTLRGSVDEVQETEAKLVRLMAGFGVHSQIRFRYVHDFTYGFDWAKWVAREPNLRSGIGPFDEAFLDYLEVRQAELLTLIAQNDATYGRLEGAEPRNPFAFSREPDDERRLHEALAQNDNVPVETWEIRGRVRWGARFAEAREERARQMGLTNG